MDHLRAVMRDRPSEMHHRGLLGPRSSVGWLDVAMDLSVAPGGAIDDGAGVLDSFMSSLARGALGGDLLSRRNSSFNFGDMLCDFVCPRVPSAHATYSHTPLPAICTSRLDILTTDSELSRSSDAPDESFFPHNLELAQPPPPLLAAPASAEPQVAAKKVYQCHSCPKTYGTSEGLRLGARARQAHQRQELQVHTLRTLLRACQRPQTARLAHAWIFQALWQRALVGFPRALDGFLGTDASLFSTKSFACKSELRRLLNMARARHQSVAAQ